MGAEERILYLQSPQSIGRVLDAGFRLFRASFLPVLPLSMTIAALIQLPQMAQLSAGSLPDAIPSSSLALAFFLVCVPLYLAGYMGMLLALDARARGAAMPGFVACFSAGLGRLPTAVGAMLLYLLVVAVGLVLLLVPGVILMVSMGFALPLVMLERHRALESLNASHALVWGHWWRTTAVLTVGALVYYLPSLLVGGAIGFALSIGSEGPAADIPAGLDPLFLASMTLTEWLLTGLMLPLLNSVALAQFHDLKLRRSGADLLARASAAG